MQKLVLVMRILEAKSVRPGYYWECVCLEPLDSYSIRSKNKWQHCKLRKSTRVEQFTEVRTGDQIELI